VDLARTVGGNDVTAHDDHRSGDGGGCGHRLPEIAGTVGGPVIGGALRTCQDDGTSDEAVDGHGSLLHGVRAVGDDHRTLSDRGGDGYEETVQIAEAHLRGISVERVPDGDLSGEVPGNETG